MSTDVSYLPEPQDQFYADVVDGLNRRPRQIPSKYLYDEAGCELFNQITELDEYYLTRTELALTRTKGHLISSILGPEAHLVDLGPGSGEKASLLLDFIQDPAGYIPVDFSKAALEQSCKLIAYDFPKLPIHPLQADFTADWQLPPLLRQEKLLFYYPGSTIGNLPPPDAERFLRRLANLTSPGGSLLIGVDLLKAPSILEAAYDDMQGTTAAFNLNLLTRINRECGARFDLDAFEHQAIFNHQKSHVEMHLVSTRDQIVHFPNTHFYFEDGESIITETSHKYTIERFASLAESAGWRTRAFFSDDDQFFSIWLLQRGFLH